MVQQFGVTHAGFEGFKVQSSGFGVRRQSLNPELESWNLVTTAPWPIAGSIIPQQEEGDK